MINKQSLNFQVENSRIFYTQDPDLQMVIVSQTGQAMDF